MSRPWFLLCLLLAGCPAKIKDPQLEAAVEILPKEEDQTEPLSEITVRDLKRGIARLRLEREGLDAGPLPEELRAFLVDQMIEQRLLAMEAERLGVRASTIAVAREIAAMRRALPEHRFDRFLVDTFQTEKDLERALEERLMSASVIAREVEAKVEISEAELKHAFEQLPEDQRVRPTRVHAAQIMVPTEDAARAILKKLRSNKNADFAALAKANSIAPDAEEGGDLGWFEKGDMPAVFDEVCFSLSPGEVSEVAPSELGYHVFRLIAREEERPLTFEEAKPALSEKLRSERLRDQERNFMESLMARYRVVRHEQRIARAMN